MNPERDFREDLRTQLLFIQNSCTAYDLISRIEAIRIATALRIIFHNTKNSTCLLRHLRREQVSLLSTAPQLNEGIGEKVLFQGFIQVVLSSQAVFCRAPLSDAAHHYFLDRDNWWNQVLYIRKIDKVTTIRVSRKDLILASANKDGGAHVDDALPASYHGLKRGIWTARFYSPTGQVMQERRIPNTQLPMLRQIGYEVLNSPNLLKLANMTVSAHTASEEQ